MCHATGTLQRINGAKCLLRRLASEQMEILVVKLRFLHCTPTSFGFPFGPDSIRRRTRCLGAFGLAITCVALVAASSSCAQTPQLVAPPDAAQAESAKGAPTATSNVLDTHIGKLVLENGYPSQDSVKKLYDELDFQRAVQTYIWATPVVSLDALRLGNKNDWGVDYNTVGLVDHYTGPEVEALTANNTTIYAAVFVDLGRDGPMVIDSPTGAYGVIDDYWQRPIVEIGPFGPDKGRGGKFLLLPPGYNGKVPKGYFTVRSSTSRAMYLGRGIVKEGNVQGAVDTLKTIRVYPLNRASHPPVTKFVLGEGRPMHTIPPRGYEYWERLADIINREPVEARDRFFHAMLKPLGIEKGKPFQPDERQKHILTEAAEVGFRMAQVISMAPRTGNVVGYPGTHWEWVVTLNPNQEAENYSQLDERTDYTFEAITVAAGMVKPIVGAGSQYMSAAKDKNGAWLDGGKSYRLRVPAQVPAKDFWAVTVYDNMTRSMIQTDTKKTGVSPHDQLQTNRDGSIDVYFGPSAPTGKESNWIKTTPGKGWFAYFRWYGPTEAFFDKSWKLSDIEETK